MTEKTPIISLKDIKLSFSDKKVLDGVSFDIYPKEIVTIAGPSGSGKSTILKLITGLIDPDSGEIIIGSKKIGMAFQYPALFNSMTVWENVALGLKETTTLNDSEINTKVEEALQKVNMANTDSLYPDELSGGMQKRVSIARTLVLEPDIILYDEPSTGLDPATASRLEDDMLHLRDEIGVTSIVVTHVTDTIIKVSDRILILDNSKIKWQGTKEEFLTDKSPYPVSFRERKPLNN